jgi:predicted nucleotidyltransferase
MSVLSYLLAIAEEVKIQDWERTKIDTSINTLSYKLGNHFNNLSSKYVFGSYDRKTILRRSKDNNSDVDFMVVFSDGANYKPQTLMSRLKGFAEANYSRNEIYQSSPTIVLELSHIKFELVPAYSSWLSTYIPAPSSHYEDWITTDPSSMKTALNSKNSSNYYMMRKLIRILKYWNAKNGKVYSSYALEKSIVETYYWGCSNLRDYFYTAVEALSTYNVSIYSADKVNSLKSKCKSAKKLEAENYPYSAQTEIEKLFA